MIRRLALLAILIAAPAFGQSISPELTGNGVARYEQLIARIEALKLATDLPSKLELAKLYATGIPAGPGNPISKPDNAAADALLAEIIAGGNPALRQQALALRATILQRSPIVADIEAGKAIDLQLAGEGYAPSLARLINSGGALPPGLTAEAATQSLNTALLKGDSGAAFALSKLLAASDPERSKVLAGQALILLSAEAGKGVSASTELGRRFLYGDGVPADPARAMDYFTIAIKDGANGPLTILHQAVLQRVPGLDVAEVKALIVASLAAGSSKAAELIASDGMDAPIYGFTTSDALYAISLMAEIGDRSALLLAVKAYVRGLNGSPDIDKAIPYIE
jgi:TPR repeat protein